MEFCTTLLWVLGASVLCYCGKRTDCGEDCVSQEPGKIKVEQVHVTDESGAMLNGCKWKRGVWAGKKNSGPGRDKETGSGGREALPGPGWQRGNGSSKGVRSREKNTRMKLCLHGGIAQSGHLRLIWQPNVSAKGKIWELWEAGGGLGRGDRKPRILPRPLANCGRGRRPEALPSPVYRRLVVRVERPGEGARRHLEVHGVG